jgi:hypothetical protein
LTDAANPEDEAGALSSVLRQRLAWAPSEGCPTREELGLERAAQHAVDWQSHRNRALWEEFALGTRTYAAARWVREIFGLFGIAGELILTSVEASAEVEITRRAQKVEPLPAMRASQWRTIRFFAEGQANNLIVFGHTVANLTIRTLAMHPDFTVRGMAGLKQNVFVPRSADRWAWASLTPALAREFALKARLLGSGSQQMADSVAALTAGPWDELWRLRGEQYHRWRGESPGVSGINFGGESMNDRLVETGSVSLGDMDAPYVEGELMVDELVYLVDRALKFVADWMPTYLDAWGEAFMAVRESFDTPPDGWSVPDVGDP